MTRNPSVRGKLCALCGKPSQSYCHIEHRGIGGDPQRKRTDGFPACGFDHSDATTCHGKVGQGLIDVWRDAGILWWRNRHDGYPMAARWQDTDADAVDAP